MKRVVMVALCGLLCSSGYAAAEEDSETVPKTFDGAGGAFKEGGREIGEGFKGIGRGIRDTFTGQRSADNYKEGKKVGTGFKDLGRGVAGGARAVGRGTKKAVNDATD